MSTARRPAPRSAHPLAGAALACVLAVGGCASGTEPAEPSGTTGPDASPTATSTAGSPTPSGTTEPPTGPSPDDPSSNHSGGADRTGVATQITVPVYYLDDVAGGPRLYREFHRVPSVTGGPVAAAVAAMLHLAARDPDYTSPWPAGTELTSVRVTDEQGARVATVDLSRFVALGAAYEAAAVQQLVHTVTAADSSIAAVRVRVGGRVPASGHMDWSRPVRRASSLGTLSNVWILTPQQGQSVTSPVKVHVYGTGFEGNVPLKVFPRGGSSAVATTFVTTMMGGYAEATTSIALPDGQYELHAYTDSGEDGSLILWDTKSFTVR